MKFIYSLKTNFGGVLPPEIVEVTKTSTGNVLPLTIVEGEVLKLVK